MQGGSEDDLDRLSKQYEAEALADCKAVEKQKRFLDNRQKGMLERREDALSTRIPSDNKYEHFYCMSMVSLAGPPQNNQRFISFVASMSTLILR